MTQNVPEPSGAYAITPFFLAIQEMLSGAIVGVRLQRFSNTVVRQPAAPGDQQVGLALGGYYRFVSANVDATHPGGPAGAYVCWAVGSANSYTVGPPTNDSTDYTFQLQILPSGSTPTTDLKRAVANVGWDGQKITTIDMLVGVAADQARHAAQHAATGLDPITPAAIGAQPQNQIVTALPTVANSYAGQEILLRPDPTNNPSTLWHLRYDASAAQAVRWQWVGGGEMTADSTGSSSTASAAYVRWANGPVLKTPFAGDYRVAATATINANAGTSATACIALAGNGDDSRRVGGINSNTDADFEDSFRVRKFANVGFNVEFALAFRVVGGPATSHATTMIDGSLAVRPTALGAPS